MVHTKCQNIDECDQNLCVCVWGGGGGESLGYICVVCRSANDGKFDFLMGTERGS